MTFIYDREKQKFVGRTVIGEPGPRFSTDKNCCCCPCCKLPEGAQTYSCDNRERKGICSDEGGTPVCSQETCDPFPCCNGACQQGTSCSIKADVICAELGGLFRGCGSCCGGADCPGGQLCVDGQCECPPERVCGEECCPEGQTCVDGQCVAAPPCPGTPCDHNVPGDCATPGCGCCGGQCVRDCGGWVGFVRFTNPTDTPGRCSGTPVPMNNACGPGCAPLVVALTGPCLPFGQFAFGCCVEM